MPTNRGQFDGSTIAALGLWSVVGSVSLVLVGRAMSGVFDQPVSLAVPVLVTAIVGGASLAAWTLFHRDARRGDAGRRIFDGLLAMMPVGLAGFSCCVNATPLTLAIVSALLVCGIAYVAVREGARPSRSAIASDRVIVDESVVGPANADLESDIVSNEWPCPAADAAVEVPVPESFTRRTLPAGGEEIEAVLIARFRPGERQTAVHLPIHPALPTSPHVECEPLDDASVTARPTAVYGYGVRVEVKRKGPFTAAADVPIGLLMTSPQSGESAA